MELPTITDKAEMLAALSENSAARIIDTIDLDRSPLCHALCACDPSTLERLNIIAWINPKGSAQEILEDAYIAAMSEDHENAVWALPIHYGPYSLMWMLPKVDA